MNLIFCGTPRFAMPTLETLALAEDRFNIQLVVTQPDRPRGRGLEVVGSPIKQRALQLGLNIVQPATIKNNAEFRAQLLSLAPDAIIVVGYGRIIPPWMLDLPRLGNINLHASLLPKYRGAAPIQWAIARGETVTGITTMKIDSGLDTGDILLQREIPVAAEDTAETVAPALANAGAALMVDTLLGLQAGDIHPRRQDDAQASLAPILKKADGLIDFSRTAAEILSRLRGFQPWPGVYTKFRGKNLQLWRARLFERTLPPGALSIDGVLAVGCGQGSALEVLEVQMEGKKRISAPDFIRGYRPVTGEKLGV